MLIRSTGIAYTAKKRWPIKLSWEGVFGGVLIIFAGFVLSKV
jgi:hypothetical protein